MMAEASNHGPLVWLAEGYWAESRRPLASLVFVLPLLAAYEVGVLWGVQNGADAWMRSGLRTIGFGQHLLLPVLTVFILLGWHHVTRQSWRLSGGILPAMLVECVLLAVVLRLILQLQGSLLQAIGGPLVLSLGAKLQEAVGFLGAGIYEELLFRLILLSLAIWGLGCCFSAPRAGMMAAVLLTSLGFAAAHHMGPNGEAWQWFTFLFRFLAGVFFSILFVYRGFGIAAGAHAFYDILVGLC